MNTTIEDLEARRTELVDEKAAITQELAKLKPLIETTPPYLRGSAEYRDLLDRRSELTSDQADMEAELQEVNAKIRKARAAAGSPAFHLGHVVSMVAARIAAGDSRPVADLADEAKRDLEEIKLAIQ